MYRAVTAEQSRALEARAVENGRTLSELMEAAGAAVASAVADRAGDGGIVFACGAGNNGGDGWVAARLLHVAGRSVEVLSIVPLESLSGIAGDAARRAVEAGVAWSLPAPDAVPERLSAAGCVVDALLGTGSRLPLRDPYPAWCEAIGSAGGLVVAVDLPTGVDADSGGVAPEAVQADCTVTFGHPKLGLVTYPGAAHAGEVIVADIGLALDAPEVADAPEIRTPDEYAAWLPLPRADAHKNSRGRVLVIAGSGAFPGAAVLATRGAMRMGAGYVTLAVPEPVVATAQRHLVAAPVVGLPAGRTRAFSAAAAGPALELARDYDAVVLGPGLTLTAGAVALARAVVADVERPLVVDADGLNALVDAVGLLERRAGTTVLTPHPGELARLLSASVSEVQADRVSSSAKLAGPGATVVLKGAGTVVTTERRTGIVTAGTPALATAGTGDVLAGMVGTLLAQGLAPHEAGLLGAYVHARAGEAAAAELTPLGVTAEDLPDYVPVAVGELLRQW